MKVTTVGDELIYANGKSKVIAISGKDRISIGLAGQYGTAYMHSPATGRFITSDYYMSDYPGMVEGILRRQAAGQVFRPELDAAASRRGLRALRFPTIVRGRQITKASARNSRISIDGGAKEPNKTYYDAMLWTPFGDLLTLDFVKAAIEGENLGNNPAGVPDMLAISWTSHDYVNHLFGPESRQSQDHTVRLDRVFAELFAYLDQRVGLDNVLITLSADHGFMNIPEYSVSRRLDAGRIDPGQDDRGHQRGARRRSSAKASTSPRGGTRTSTSITSSSTPQAQPGGGRERCAGVPPRLSRSGGRIHPHPAGTRPDAATPSSPSRSRWPGTSRSAATSSS